MPEVTNERLLQPAKLKREKVALPAAEFGEDAYVWLQRLAAEDILEMQHRFGPAVDMDMLEFKAHVLRLSLIHEDGSPRFARKKDSGLSPEDAATAADAEVIAFLKSSWGSFQLLARKAMELSDIMMLLDDEGEEKN